MSDITLQFVIGGDLFPTEKNLSAYLDGKTNSVFDETILHIFREADFSVFNLEGCLTESRHPIQKCDPIIKAPIGAIKGIAELNPSMIALANNHIMDYGELGYYDTCKALREAGIEYLGVGDNSQTIIAYKLIVDKGINIGLYNVAETMFNTPSNEKPGVNIYDEYKTCKELERIKRDCDYLIVLYHGGVEFFWYTSQMLRKRFHRMADSGADIVIAQHTHNISVREYYNGSYLNYGQGDLLFPTSVSEYKKTGLLIEVLFRKDGFSIIEHLLNHEGEKASYDQSQDLSSFEERNRRLQDGDLFDEEYRIYCHEQMIKFFRAFRGSNLLDKLYRRLMPEKRFAEYIVSKYNDKHIMRIISALQFEEFNNIAQEGLKCMLKKKE